MSQRYKGGVISATPPTVSATSPNAYGTAKGVWTLQQQFQYEGAGTWPSPFSPVYIEDVFSTYLYTGNGTTQAIANGVNLSTNGGMVWIKPRNQAQDHIIFDTLRGVTKSLTTNNTAAEYTATAPDEGLSSFNTNGFTAKLYQNSTGINNSSCNNASWTFRKAEKFFDVVTYTGNGTFGRAIAHNLGSTPGCIIVKCTSDGTLGWRVYHRSLTSPNTLALNTTDAQVSDSGYFSTTAPTSTNFYVGDSSWTNGNGKTYVAYLFAHDASGFGANGTDNVISCGSFTSATGGATVTLGWEPQWILVKQASASGDGWHIIDTTRKWTNGGTNETVDYDYILDADSSASELTGTSMGYPTANGFFIRNIGSGVNCIYIAIRRGPMKTPTSGTEVFQPLTGQPNGSGVFAHNIFTDFSFYHYVSGAQNWGVQDRLRGVYDLSFNSTAAENGLVGGNEWDRMTGYINSSPAATLYDSWAFRRAPGFMDVVCYAGNANNRTLNHNLAVVPELMIVKRRDTAGTNWVAYHKDVGATKYLVVNTTAAPATLSTIWNNTAPTASVFSLGNQTSVNASGGAYVWYGFASIAGVSSVGSYTGTGTTLQVNCGFTGGSRLVLIKRTDTTGDWYLWDSARGISSGNDPYILLNSSATNVTGTDYLNTYNSGFELTSGAPAGINANGGTYIFLAIA